MYALCYNRKNAETARPTEENDMAYKKPSKFYYGIMRCGAALIAKCLFRRKFLRNELKGQKGPFVVIANHEAALDFTTIVGATREQMHFVISHAFYNTVPIRGMMERAGLIPKQQYQTSVRDIKKMRAATENGQGLVLFPAGLMSEDGRSAPMPTTTYQFLQWLKADVYVARIAGTYFCTPKWSKRKRPGRTYLDVYKLFSKEELLAADPALVKERVDEALDFDAYREQDALRIKYRHGDNIEGLENVLYMCPHCKAEFSTRVRGKNVIYCKKCGFAEKSDKYAMLNLISDNGEEIRYASDWGRAIYEHVRDEVARGGISEMRLKAKIQMIDLERKHFVDAGEGEVLISKEALRIVGTINGESADVSVATAQFASLPFGPGKYFEIQHGDDSYRCFPEDSKIVTKVVNVVKAFYELGTKK